MPPVRQQIHTGAFALLTAKVSLTQAWPVPRTCHTHTFASYVPPPVTLSSVLEEHPPNNGSNQGPGNEWLPLQSEPSAG